MEMRTSRRSTAPATRSRWRSGRSVVEWASRTSASGHLDPPAHPIHHLTRHTRLASLLPPSPHRFLHGAHNLAPARRHIEQGLPHLIEIGEATGILQGILASDELNNAR